MPNRLGMSATDNSQATVEIISIGSSYMIHRNAAGKPACGRTSKRHHPAVGHMTEAAFAAWTDRCSLCF